MLSELFRRCGVMGVLLALLNGPLAACDENESTAEKVGEAVEEAGDEAGDAVEDAGDAVEDATQ